MTELLSKEAVANLDAISKLATILGCIGIWVAYRQYRLSVTLYEANDRRASVELAARECLHFGTEINSDLQKLHKQLEQSGCEYFSHSQVIPEAKGFKLDYSKVTESDREKLKEHLPTIISVLNKIEGFAIPFASGVANDDIGFIECGRAFVTSFEHHVPIYANIDQRVFYRASQSVYWKWKTRIAQQELETKHAEAGKEFFMLTEQVVRGRSSSLLAQAIASFFQVLSSGRGSQK